MGRRGTLKDFEVPNYEPGGVRQKVGDVVAECNPEMADLIFLAESTEK